MRHNSFGSKADLKRSLEEFIEYFNRTFARPFDWRYTGTVTPEQNLQRPKTWKAKWETNRQPAKLKALVG